MNSKENKMCFFAREYGLPIPPGFVFDEAKQAYVCKNDAERNRAYEFRIMDMMQRDEMSKHLSTISGWATFFGILTIIGMIASCFIIPAILNNLRYW